MSIGDNIKKLRIEKNLTQKELSSLTGISEVMISQYERNVRTPKNKNLKKIAFILDKSGSHLLGEDLPFNLIGSDDTIMNLSSPIATVNDLPLELYECKLLNNYRRLNTLGKKEANKRVEELTEINKYTEPDKTPKSCVIAAHNDHSEEPGELEKMQEDAAMLNAAHHRTDIDIPEGTDTSDNDIMDDENF